MKTLDEDDVMVFSEDGMVHVTVWEDDRWAGAAFSVERAVTLSRAVVKAAAEAAGIKEGVSSEAS